MDMQTPTLEEVVEPHEASGQGTALACLLEYAPGVRVALPIHAGVELVEQPQAIPVPGMPEFAVGLMAWQGRQLALLDLARYFHGPDAGAPAAAGHALVVAYQRAPGEAIEYGALLAPNLVRMIEVTDSLACATPAQPARMEDVAVAAFSFQEQAVPVLELSRIFALSG